MFTHNQPTTNNCFGSLVSDDPFHTNNRFCLPPPLKFDPHRKRYHLESNVPYQVGLAEDDTAVYLYLEGFVQITDVIKPVNLFNPPLTPDPLDGDDPYQVGLDEDGEPVFLYFKNLVQITEIRKPVNWGVLF